MKKDWVILGGCIGLFLAGGVYFHMLPEVSWKREVGVGDIVSTVSALAAAFAAYAAWQSATISKDAASQSRTHSRLQVYIMHREQFYSALDSIEADHVVRFYCRDELYNDLFPRNRFIDQDFESTLSHDHIDSWSESYAKLAKLADLLPLDGDAGSDRSLAAWSMDYTYLSRNYLRYKVETGGALQFFVSGEIATGLCCEYIDNYLWKMHNIINALYRFGAVTNSVVYTTPTENLKQAFNIMRTRVAMGLAVHNFKK